MGQPAQGPVEGRCAVEGLWEAQAQEQLGVLEVACLGRVRARGHVRAHEAHVARVDTQARRHGALVAHQAEQAGAHGAHAGRAARRCELFAHVHEQHDAHHLAADELTEGSVIRHRTQRRAERALPQDRAALERAVVALAHVFGVQLHRLLQPKCKDGAVGDERLEVDLDRPLQVGRWLLASDIPCEHSHAERLAHSVVGFARHHVPAHPAVADLAEQ